MSDQFKEAYVPDEVPEEDLAYFGKSDDRVESLRREWGDNPALLVVDMTNAFVSDEYYLGRSDTGQPAIEANERLIDAAREADVPVFYTHGTDAEHFPPDYQGTTKSAGGTDEEFVEMWETGNQIHEDLAPEPEDVVIQKPRASAFFDTHLANLLHHYDIDTLIVTGMTTSGCVRATAVDAHSSNFHVVVPIEAAADRSVISHKISLFDMDMKYADVLPVDEVLDELRTTRAVADD
ncbi:cysteine hydrolase family protein [Halosimplex halobium]|uniref:cysteine hydrolase family protein n=1 Tax=Halosimplex halobium TaxID=3396618 RepID=UPI003F553957